MRDEIGSYEAKTRLPELLREVKAGKSFTITIRGEAIAELVPAGASKRTKAIRAIEEMKSFMAADPIPNVDIKALREEGRR
jgi:prevent-host-death family protein